MTAFHWLAAAVFALASIPASGQLVKGNEAVTISPSGVRKAETPPLPATGSVRHTKPCAAADGCNAGAWVMVETSEGLMECTEAYARAGTCRKSTYGSSKLLRLWLVRKDGKWQQCQLPDLTSKCVDMFARPPSNLPFPAVQ